MKRWSIPIFTAMKFRECGLSWKEIANEIENLTARKFQPNSIEAAVRRHKKGIKK